MSRFARSDLVDLDVIIHHETERAVLVSDDGNRDRAVWLPLAAVEIERNGKDAATITLSERLATDRGLL